MVKCAHCASQIDGKRFFAPNCTLNALKDAVAKFSVRTISNITNGVIEVFSKCDKHIRVQKIYW